METYAPGGAGVHPEHTLSLGDERLVAVPVHDYPRVRTRRGVDQSVHKVYPYALQVYVHPQRQPEVPELTVIVPDHGRCWHLARQTGEHVLSTDVAGVKYEVDALERGRHSWIQVPMRVRNQPDQHRLRLYMRKCGRVRSPVGEENFGNRLRERRRENDSR